MGWGHSDSYKYILDIIMNELTLDVAAKLSYSNNEIYLACDFNSIKKFYSLQQLYISCAILTLNREL